MTAAITELQQQIEALFSQAPASYSERAVALLRRFSVGTTTIDVGVDLTGPKSKEFLVCEARSPAQAIQRIGRLGRRGREIDSIEIPNTVWLVVPDYVYHFVEQRNLYNRTYLK